MASTEFAMPFWVVFDHPTDFPDIFIARLFHGEAPTNAVIKGDTLADVRALIPHGLVCLTRSPDDDPKIVECWF